MRHGGGLVSRIWENGLRLFTDVQISPRLPDSEVARELLSDVTALLVESLKWFSAMVLEIFPTHGLNPTRCDRPTRYLFTYAYRCYSVIGVTCWEGEYFADVDSRVSTKNIFRDVE